MNRYENLRFYFVNNSKKVRASGMARGMKPFLSGRYLPLPVTLNVKAKASELKVIKPVMQTMEVNLLLLVVRLTRAINVKTARSGANAG